jgi:hypothetical protein
VTDEPQVQFVLRLRVKPGYDPIHSLRRALKYALRQCGLRCISAHQETEEIPASAGIGPGVPGNS